VRFAHAQLSRNRRDLIRGILDNHEEASFLSSRAIAKRYHVDATTVVRARGGAGHADAPLAAYPYAGRERRLRGRAWV
jgi:hypothetical protein